MFQRVAVLVVSCGAFLVGCGTDPQVENEEIISNLVEAGFPAEDITVVDEAVYVGRDVRVSVESSREMIQPGEGSQEQYRTTNIVNPAVVPKICLNPNATFNSYSRLSQGLDLAIANYNELGLCFTFARGTPAGCNATVTVQTTTGGYGDLQTPVGGRPSSYLRIGTALQGYSLDVSEHVITHMLGHLLGLRHSDYYNRAISCGGSPTNEGSAGVGAIHIPGTPTLATAGGSVMNACYRSTETGEFSSTDIIALQTLFGC